MEETVKENEQKEIKTNKSKLNLFFNSPKSKSLIEFKFP